MKKLISICLLLALALSLFACGGEEAKEAEGTKAPQQTAEHSGITFQKDPVWRNRKAILEVPNTIETWIKMPETGSGRSEVILSNFGEAYDFNSKPYLTLKVEPAGHPVLEWVLSEELSYSWNFNDANLRTGQWTHLALVRDVEAGRIYCYVNGELADEYKERYSMDLLPRTSYCVGGDHTHKNENYFSGEMESLRIYSTARSAEQVKADMAEPAAEGLICAWDFRTAEGITVKDASGNGWDLTQSTRWFTDKEPVTDYAFSFMAVPDTQIVAVSEPEKMAQIYDYIVENAEARNVKFVMGMGDITNDDTYEEWSAAKAAIFKMDGVVPYSLVRGNTVHDSPAKFNEAFPMEKYNLGGYMKQGDMRNVYHLFEVGDIKYMVLVVDCSPSDEMLDWANQVVAQHPDRNVILTTHVYLNKNTTPMKPTDYAPGPTNTGVDIWEKLVRKHENIVMVLCGHDASAQVGYGTMTGDHGNTVTHLLLNGQGVEDSQEGNSGFVATLYFSEDGKDVTVEYYSTLRKAYFLTENQFSFTLDLVD